MEVLPGAVLLVAFAVRAWAWKARGQAVAVASVPSATEVAVERAALAETADQAVVVQAEPAHQTTSLARL